MALNPQALQRAIAKTKKQLEDVTPPQDKAAIQRAVSRTTGKPTPPDDSWDDPDIWKAPAIVGKIPALKSLVGVSQELAETLYKAPRLFGLDIGHTPKTVETGFGEKTGAGIMEYLLGGAGVKAIPAIGKGFQALGKVPAVGRALASPFTKTMAGMGAMGALEDPEHPVRGALMSAGLGAGAELGFKIPSKAVDFMTKAKWSPFHSSMMPHIKREFNEYLGSIGRKLGLTTEHDTDLALFDTLEAKYKKATDSASALYDRASSFFKGVKEPVYWKEGLRGRVLPVIKDIQESYGKSPDAFGIKINRTMKELEGKIDDPIAFRRKIHAAERDAVKTGNFDLFDSLAKVEKNFNKGIGDLAGKTKDPALSRAFEALRKADTYFKDNVVPLRKRASVKLEEGKRKAIPTKFFQAHSKDTSENLGNKISGNLKDLEHMSKVAPEIKDHLAYNHLKKGMDKPEAFIQEYSAMSKEQKEAIFTKEEIARFDKFKKIYSKNPAAFRESEPTTIMQALRGAPLKKVGEAISAIPRARESYIGGVPKGIGGSPVIPTSKSAIRAMVMGALLGETKE